MSKAEKTTFLKAEIEYFCTMKGYSIEELAIKLGISRASLYNRMKDMSKFSGGELMALFSILHFDDTKILKIMK